MRLLSLGTFPVYPLEFGGQQRVHAIARELLRQVKGNSSLPSFRYTHIHPSSSSSTSYYPGCRQISLKHEDGQRLTKRLSEVHLLKALSEDRGARRVILEESRNHDAILLSQPYLMRLIKKSRKPIILDMHDVEALVKSSEVKSEKERTILHRIEKEALDRADLVLFTTQQDASYCEYTYSLPKEKYRVVRNSVSSIFHTKSLRNKEKACRKLGIPAILPTVLYLSSAHAPNVRSGHWLLDNIAPTAPNVQFLIVGPACWLYRNREIRGNVTLLYERFGEELNSVFEASDIGINVVHEALPGSDLKALEYGRRGLPILASPMGVRGHNMEAGTHYYPYTDREYALWRLIENKDLQGHLIFNMNAHLKSLNWKSEVAAIKDDIQDLIDDNRKRNESISIPRTSIAHSLNEFESGLGTTLSSPTEICFDLTNDCHVRCLHCYRTYLGNTATYLPLDVFYRIPDRFYRNAKRIELSGMGEPMLHPKFNEILNVVGAYQNAQVSFNSSFTITDDRTLYRIVELGCTPAVSIDGARKETFERIRKRSRQETVFNAVSQMAAHAQKVQNPKFYPRIQWTLYKDNFRELHEIIPRASDWQIKEVRVQPLAPHRPEMNDWCIDPTDNEVIDSLCQAYERANEDNVYLFLHPHLLRSESLKALAEENSKRQIPWVKTAGIHYYPDHHKCSYPWTQLNIDSDGYIVACCFSDYRLGHVHNQSVEEIWNNHFFAEFRRDVNTPKASKFCTDSPSGGVCCPRIQSLFTKENQSHYLQKKEPASVNGSS